MHREDDLQTVVEERIVDADLRKAAEVSVVLWCHSPAVSEVLQLIDEKKYSINTNGPEETDQASEKAPAPTLLVPQPVISGNIWPRRWISEYEAIEYLVSDAFRSAAGHPPDL